MPSIAPTLCTVYGEPSSTPGIFGESIVEPIQSLTFLEGGLASFGAVGALALLIFPVTTSSQRSKHHHNETAKTF